MRQVPMFLSLALAFSVWGCKSSSPEADSSDVDAAAVFGQGVTLDKVTEIETILNNPDDFVGRRVAIRGWVRRVCPMKGCWVELEGPASAKIQVKVEDGVIVFPGDVIGKMAVAEGTVERLTFTRDEYISRRQHEAEEAGETFDPSEIGGPPFEVIRIWGSGARIFGSAEGRDWVK